jgi:hypothetical protein
MRIVCLPSAYRGRQLDLVTLGANARRAIGDSTTVAYLEAPNPSAARFTHPMLETAVIPWISQGSGKAAMARLLTLISQADSGSLRESLREALHQT